MSQLIYPLRGGVHPPENKSQSLQQPLRKLGLAKELVLPLNQHIGAPAKPIVDVGQRVLTGQMIAEANGPFSAAVHASSSGTVTAIEPRPIAHPSGLWADCMVISCDGKDEWLPLEACADPFSLDAQTLLSKIRNAGIAGMGGAGFPSSVKLNPPPNHKINTLIINGTECEPYITADDLLMQERSEDILQGCALLAQLLGGPESIVIGVEDNKPKAIEALQQALRALDPQHTPGCERINIVSFPTKYPSGGEKQLIQILTGKEVPSGGLPAHIGIVVQNVGTTVAIWEAIKLGKPLIERITTVVGESLREQGNALVRLGTPCEFVLEQFGFKEQQCARLIVGGPMMGFSLDNRQAPVVKTSNCLLVPSHQEMPEPAPAQACIRCGHCAEACPAGLLPQQLYWYAQAKDHDRLQAHNLMDCIECGACSFVCPSSIPLVQYYRASKGDIRQAAIEKEKSDRSRQRFEFRQKRIEQAEAEKEAKRLARKKAAEAAKAKAASATNTAPAKDSAAAADPVAAALARVQAQQADPAEQLNKLERALNNARNRAKSAEEKWQQAEGEQKAKLESRFKQAELRVNDAQSKLAEFQQQAQAKNEQAANAQTADINSDDPIERAKAKAQQRMTMSPLEKAQNTLQNLQGRLQKAEQKLAAADEDKREAMAAAVDKLKQKISASEQEVKELESAAPSPAAAIKPEDIDDPIERAKAKALQRLTMSPAEKLQNSLASLQSRLAKAEEKMAAADADKREALQAGVNKLQEKIAVVEQEIADLKNATQKEPVASQEQSKAAEVPMDAASAAIEKAKAKAAAQAAMSDDEKRQAQIESLQQRISKAQQRLDKAVEENNDNVDAFRMGLEKLQSKLTELESE